MVKSLHTLCTAHSSFQSHVRAMDDAIGWTQLVISAAAAFVQVQLEGCSKAPERAIA
jgi:hypothetical protein